MTGSNYSDTNPGPSAPVDRRLSVAPMQDWTDRHDRYFLRLCSRRALLYTEMIPAQALWHGKRAAFLDHADFERPLAAQFGGSDPEQLRLCARLAQDWGYDEVNLNVGCPSDRVQSGRFGACLMAEPELVGDLVVAMRDACDLPVTVKTRIGIDDQDEASDLMRFVETVREAGCRSLTIHARKAWLQGLNPKENREIPPLRYDRVRAVKSSFPDLEVIINGGVQDLDQAESLLADFDGVMMGRAAYHDPYQLAWADQRIFGESGPVPDRHEILESYIPYMADQLTRGVRLSHMTRHILGLFQGVPGARRWRRFLSENAHRPDAGIEVVREAARQVAPPVSVSA